MKFGFGLGLFTGLILFAGTVTSAVAQDPTYHLKVVSETLPTGPEQTFYAKLVLEEHSTDVSGFFVKIGYDNTRVDFTGVQNNTNQPVGLQYTRGSEEIALAGVPYANVYRVLLLESSFNIEPPVDPAADYNMARLVFTTKAGYDITHGNPGIFLDERDAAGGMWDGNIDDMTVEYISLPATSSVADWAVY